MSLRLIWASPWNERSAIALFSVQTVQELVKLGHHVEVLRTEVGEDLLLPPRPSPWHVEAVGTRPIAHLADSFDGIIVNLGNYYGFHGGAMPILRETAPLLILHDAWMGHFIEGWRRAAGDDSWRIDRLLDRLEAEGQESRLATLCAQSSGAIVHGPHYRALVEASCPGPVACLPLSMSFDALPRPEPIGDRLVVTTIGHVNQNKRSEEVIRALGASEQLRDRVLYVLAGPVEPEEQARLLALASQVGAPEPFFTGWVPEEMLRMLMVGTNVVCCLRYPALEGGSASLLFSLLSARPTLVSDHASYADIPDDLVFKCAPGQEAAYVMHHLEAILADPAKAQATGERARDYAKRKFSPEIYTTGLLQALDAATRAAPAIRAGRSIGRRLAELGIRPGDPALDRIDAELAGLMLRRGEQLV